jgi:multiple sugar transport system substrate-binding protein
MRARAVALAVALVLAPLGAQAADLVVWWDKGSYAQEDEAVREIIAAFEQKTGKRVDLVFQDFDEHPVELVAALEVGRPPDFAFGFLMSTYIPKWALEDRLVDLSEAIGHFSNLFDPNQLDRATLLNASTNQKHLYALPMGYVTNHLFVWKSLLQRAGFTLEDIPKDWEAFWSFWCDRVQPAVRKTLGRDDIWGVDLAVAAEPDDTGDQFFQFVQAYQANYVTPEGKLVIDDPDVRQRLVGAIDAYTAIYRKGCTPPDSATWNSSYDNNKAFLEQRAVLVANFSLSIPNALKKERPEDYYKNSATIAWPLGPTGESFPIPASVFSAVVFKEGGHVPAAEAFVRFLAADGWLMHYLDFSGERILPSIPALLDQPFWLDPGDPHRMAEVMQVQARAMAHDYTAASGDLGHDQIYNERVWSKAIHRIVADGLSPAQAVDEATLRIKQILNE